MLAEKPLAPDAKTAAALFELADRHGRLLGENFLFPHHPRHDRVRDLHAAGELGELRSFGSAFCIAPLPEDDIRYRRELGGGALLDVGVYPLKAAQFFLGGDLPLAGSTLRVCKRRRVDLSGEALLVSPTGVPATVRFGFENVYESCYSLRGTRSTLSTDRAFTPPADWSPKLRLAGQDGPREVSLPAADQVLNAVGAFAAAARASHPALPPNARTRSACSNCWTGSRPNIRIPV